MEGEPVTRPVVGSIRMPWGSPKPTIFPKARIWELSPTSINLGSWDKRNGFPVTVSMAVAWPVPAAFAAEIATMKVPTCVAAPVMTPVVGFSVSPGGSPVAE